MNRNVVLLALSQAFVMTVVSLMLSASVLVSVGLSAAPGWTTLPLAMQYLATMLALHPLARLMARWGCGPVFAGAALVGAAGLALAAAGLAYGSFAVFVLSGLCVGVFGAAGQFYRFAAAEAVPAAARGQAVALTLAGGVLAAFLGPFIAGTTRDFSGVPFQASFVVLAVLALLAAGGACLLHLPAPEAATAGAVGPLPRPLREIARQPDFRLALAGAVVGYAVMALLMTATPLAMLCAGQPSGASIAVIQWHLVAMFAPSFVTGLLIARLGLLTVKLLGGLLLLAGIGLALAGDALAHFSVALVLVGVGWNFLYVGATTLLTQACRDVEKPAVQAFNDSVVFLSVTIATLFAGRLVDSLGWEAVNRLAAVPVAALVVALLAALVLRRAGLARAA
ncbi:MAG: MFS transporter [Zoogloea sp.]|nr:MFS transporter [Zoogloea sp.]